eukprot:962158-Rhodomonas_salina.1
MAATPHGTELAYGNSINRENASVLVLTTEVYRNMLYDKVNHFAPPPTKFSPDFQGHAKCRCPFPGCVLSH